MEVTGMVIGAVGLLGLFTLYEKVAAKVHAAQHFGSEFGRLGTHLRATQTLFDVWGKEVGIHSKEGSDCHPRLENPEIKAAVEEILHLIYDVLDDSKATISHYQKAKPDIQAPQPTSNMKRPHITPISKRSRLKWAISDQNHLSHQVEEFSRLVEKLYALIPPQTASSEIVTTLINKTDEQQAFVSDEFRKLQQTLIESQRAQTVERVSRWLNATITEESLEAYWAMRLENTCDWVLAHPRYQAWLNENRSRILWIHGPAGFGKSVLCARIIKSLEDAGQPAYYFFCSGANDLQRNPSSILRSWLLQASKRDETSFDIILQYLMSKETSTATYTDIWEVLQEILLYNSNPPILIVDGFDECPRSLPDRINLDQNREAFLEQLVEIVLKTGARLLIVSREDGDIKSQFYSQYLPEDLVFELAVTKTEVSSDITKFSEHVVNQKLPNRPSELRQNLACQIADKSDGMFLLIRLQSDGLRPLKTKGQLQRVVNEMPRALVHAYERNWAEIEKSAPSDRQRARAVLRWVAFATRPLTLAELVEAVCLFDTDEDGPIYEELPEILSREYVESEIFRYCGSFIELRASSTSSTFGLQTVHLIHFSVKEFLSGVSVHAPFSDHSFQHQYLARFCLQYLRHDDTWSSSGTVEEDATESHALRSYAVPMWKEHARSCGNHSSVILPELQLFFSISNTNWGKWELYHRKHEDTEKSNMEHRPGSRVYYAALFGLNDMIDYLRNQNYDFDETGGYYHTPLQAAAAFGSMDIVTYLIKIGVNVNIAGGARGSALHAAIAGNHFEVVQKLIESGGSLSLTDNMGRTPVYLAAEEGREKIVESLMKVGADITGCNLYGRTPLNTAASDGHLEVVRLLLDHSNADLTVADEHGWTPLHFAARNGHLEVAQLLLDHNTADLTVVDKDGWTPLHSAARNGHLEVVQLLLDYNADLTVVDKHGWTPLHYAAYDGHVKVVQLLLGYNRELIAATKERYTPLHSAAWNGHLEVVQLLLDHNNADLTLVDEDGWTPLHYAARNGHLEVVQLLLDYNADLTVTDKTGMTPLNRAAYSGHIRVVQLLLDHNADLAVVDRHGWTPLHSASYNGHLEVVKFFCENGAGQDIHATISDGRTPLPVSSMDGHTEIISSCLQKYDSFLNWEDKDQRTPLFFAAARGHTQVLKALLSYDALVNTRDRYNSTPLCVAIKNGHELVVRELIALKQTDFMLTDDTGKDLFWWAVKGGNNQVIALVRQYILDAEERITEDDCNTPQPEQFPVGSAFCDVCLRHIHHGKGYYVCPVCSDGDFYVCLDCRELGMSCRDTSHDLTCHKG